MKRIPIILLLLLIGEVLSAQGWVFQHRKDFQDHYVCGALAGFTGTWASWTISGRPAPNKTDYLIGIGAAFVVSVGKEVIYDKMMRKGTPEFGDVAYATAGRATAVLVLRMTIPVKMDNSKKIKKRK